MAKNKNRKQPAQTRRSAPGEAQQTKSATAETGTDLQAAAPGGPGGTRTKQRRFGHN